MRGVRCRQCGRGVRSRGIHLWDTPKGPAYVCGKRCLAAFNEGTDVEVVRERQQAAAAAAQEVRAAAPKVPR